MVGGGMDTLRLQSVISEIAVSISACDFSSRAILSVDLDAAGECSVSLDWCASSVEIPGEVHREAREFVLNINLIHLVGADALVELLATVAQILDACPHPVSTPALLGVSSHETSFWRNPVSEALLDMASTHYNVE